MKLDGAIHKDEMRAKASSNPRSPIVKGSAVEKSRSEIEV